MKKTILLLTFLLAFVCSYAQVDYITKEFSNSAKQNFDYAVRAGVTLSFNMFTPIQGSGEPTPAVRKPTVVCFHGAAGAYTDGIIELWAKEEFARRGYVGISAEYTLGRSYYGNDRERADKENIINALCLVRYLTFNSALLGIDTSNIFLFGVSFGGITSVHSNMSQNDLSAAYFSDSMNSLYGGSANHVAASASVSGAAYDWILVYCDSSTSEHYDHHGDQDTTVPYAQAVETQNAMVALGIASTLKTYPGVAHNVGKRVSIAKDLVAKFAAIINVN